MCRFIFRHCFLMCLFFYSTCSSCLAFGGHFHYCSTSNLIERVIFCSSGLLKYGTIYKFLSKLTSDQKQIIKTASIIADVGRFSLDRRGDLSRGTNVFPSSDELEFISKLKENAKTEDEKCVVFGVELHYLQDRLVSKFFKGIFGSQHEVTYFDYCKLEKWCLLTRESCKLFSSSLDFRKTNLTPFYDEVFKVYPNLDKSITSVSPLLIGQYLSRGNFFELYNCSDLLARTYNSFPESKNLKEIICPKFISEAIDTLLGANIVLSFIPGVEFSESEKANVLKAFDDMQSDLLNLLEKNDWSFYEKE